MGWAEASVPGLVSEPESKRGWRVGLGPSPWEQGRVAAPREASGGPLGTSRVWRG